MLGPTGTTYLLNNGWDAAHDATAAVSNHYDRTSVGDFDGDGTLAVRRGSTITYTPLCGKGVRRFAFCRPADAMLVGGWDGNGTDSADLRAGRRLSPRARGRRARSCAELPPGPRS